MSSKPIYHPTNYRKNYITYWRQWYPSFSIPKGYVIHHKYPQSLCKQEGWSDEEMNHPKNLVMLWPDDHISIHRNRGDNISDKFIRACDERFGAAHHTYSGDFVTLWGTFATIQECVDTAPYAISRVMMSRLCKEEYEITVRVAARAPAFKQYVGKTSRELGFNFLGVVKDEGYKTRPGRQFRQFDFVTPWGVFTSSKLAVKMCPKRVSATSIRSWCTESKCVTRYTLAKSELFTEDDLGKTFEELGFSIREIM